jgi:hypothetical protein
MSEWIKRDFTRNAPCYLPTWPAHLARLNGLPAWPRKSARSLADTGRQKKTPEGVPGQPEVDEVRGIICGRVRDGCHARGADGDCGGHDGGRTCACSRPWAGHNNDGVPAGGSRNKPVAAHSDKPAAG